MTATVPLALGLLAALLAASAFFSSSETAIFSLPVDRIDAVAARGGERGAALKRLRDDPHRLLVTLLVGNNVVNIAISSITTALLVGVLPGGLAVTAATAITAVVVLIAGEIVPKSYGLSNAEAWALAVAGPITIVERALSPVVTVFDAVTRRLNALIGGDPAIERPYTE